MTARTCCSVGSCARRSWPSRLAELPLYRRRRVRLPLPQRFHHRDDARWIEKIRREAHHLQRPRQIELADSRLVRCEQSLHDAAQAWTRRGGRGHQGGLTEALGMSHQCVLRPHSPHRKSRRDPPPAAPARLAAPRAAHSGPETHTPRAHPEPHCGHCPAGPPRRRCRDSSRLKRASWRPSARSPGNSTSGSPDGVRWREQLKEQPGLLAGARGHDDSCPLFCANRRAGATS
jgi:hypothetical protein